MQRYFCLYEITCGNNCRYPSNGIFVERCDVGCVIDIGGVFVVAGKRKPCAGKRNDGICATPGWPDGGLEMDKGNSGILFGSWAFDDDNDTASLADGEL